MHASIGIGSEQIKNGGQLLYSDFLYRRGEIKRRSSSKINA
jgi:hypothetical protein